MVGSRTKILAISALLTSVVACEGSDNSLAPPPGIKIDRMPVAGTDVTLGTHLGTLRRVQPVDDFEISRSSSKPGQPDQRGLAAGPQVLRG